jgi:putative membrane protein
MTVMDTSSTGFWAMILCWLSAIGGIAMAILWAASKIHPRVDGELVRKSLERRLKTGEISRTEYQKRLDELCHKEPSRAGPAGGSKPPPQP